MNFKKTFLIAGLIPQFIEAVSSSMLVPRSITTDSVYELSLANFHRYHTEYEYPFQFYARPLFMESVHSNKLSFSASFTQKSYPTSRLNS